MNLSAVPQNSNPRRCIFAKHTSIFNIQLIKIELFLAPPEMKHCFGVGHQVQPNVERRHVARICEFPIILEQQMAKQYLHDVRGEEPPRTRLSPVAEAHVLWAGADQMRQVVLVRSAEFDVARGIKLFRLLPDVGIPLLKNIDPDVLALSKTQAVAQRHIFDNHAPEVCCLRQ